MDLEQIAQVLACFHDGSIEKVRKVEDSLLMDICCPYLAELMAPNSSYFYLHFDQIRKFEYEPCVIAGHTKRIIHELDQLAVGDYEIGSASIEYENVKVFCHEHTNHFNSPCGYFMLQAKGISIKTEKGEGLTIEKLFALRDRYWDSIN